MSLAWRSVQVVRPNAASGLATEPSGHSSCGAVRAAIDAFHGKPAPTPDLVRLTEAIAPAVTLVQGRPGDELVNATKANVSLVARQLRKNELLNGFIAKKRLKVVASYVNLSTGVVSLL